MCAPDLEAIEVDVSPTASVADNENIKSSESVGLIEDYAYYPRGRVLYREKDGRFVVYADRCLMAKEDKETSSVSSASARRFGGKTSNTSAPAATRSSGKTPKPVRRSRRNEYNDWELRSVHKIKKEALYERRLRSEHRAARKQQHSS
jgi:hypothetical protein